jgi:hypothetical protein
MIQKKKMHIMIKKNIYVLIHKRNDCDICPGLFSCEISQPQLNLTQYSL